MTHRKGYVALGGGGDISGAGATIYEDDPPQLDLQHVQDFGARAARALYAAATGDSTGVVATVATQ